MSQSQGEPGGEVQENPVLVLLENYILDTIGELPEQRQVAMTHVVQRVLGGGDDWKETVRLTLSLPPKIDENIVNLWNKNRRIARRRRETLGPAEFAKWLTKENFATFVAPVSDIDG